MLRHETRLFVRDMGIDRESLADRLLKLEEEIREYREVLLDPEASLDEILGESADIGIVCRTIEEIPRQHVESLGFSYDALMICTMDKARVKYGVGSSDNTVDTVSLCG